MSDTPEPSRLENAQSKYQTLQIGVYYSQAKATATQPQTGELNYGVYIHFG